LKLPLPGAAFILPDKKQTISLLGIDFRGCFEYTQYKHERPALWALCTEKGRPRLAGQAADK
jgi:hypothetical protein